MLPVRRSNAAGRREVPVLLRGAKEPSEILFPPEVASWTLPGHRFKNGCTAYSPPLNRFQFPSKRFHRSTRITRIACGTIHKLLRC